MHFKLNTRKRREQSVTPWLQNHESHINRDKRISLSSVEKIIYISFTRFSVILIVAMLKHHV